MKKFIISALILSLGSFQGFTQVMIQGTITDPAPGGNKVQVYGKNNSSTALTNVLFGNINLTFSIPDQGAGNPTEAQITKTSLIPSLDIAPTDGNNPYIISGRAYYSYIMTSNVNTTTSTWPANSTNNQIAEFTFSANSFFSGMRLDDVSPSGGPNGQMYWYVQVNGAGDITDYSTMFYGVPALPPTNNASTSPSFVPLQPFTVVPVKFLNFTVTRNNNIALLNWAVENEDANTASYEIQKSLNGIEFSSVATLPAYNNGRASNVYSFTQNNLSAIRSSGVIYFRIKQTDRDGKFVYTEIRSVRMDSKGAIVVGVYPNPVKSLANVTFDLEQNTEVIISVTDASGKQVLTSQVQGFKGANINKLNMANLASGSYTLKLQVGTETKVMPIVKVDQ
ncbi:MAG: T9SS type A sorting domain-containing protein [Chitinophagaceae bacterium]|nr:T9SS type A sorting domain-containing protein [Chitinophagaceae bacterium]